MLVAAGEWVAFHIITPCVMYEATFMTKEFIPEGFCAMAHMWADREFSRRARMHFLTPTLILPKQLGEYLEEYVSEIGEALPPFKFKGLAAVKWKLMVGVMHTIKEEKEKGAKLALLASAARAFMGDNARERFTITDVDRRQWGRLVTYVQASLGQSAYKSERDKTRGGSRPRGKRAREEGPPIEEVYESYSPTSPNYSPPKSSSQYSPTTVTTLPGSGGSEGRLTRSAARRAAAAAATAQSRYESHLRFADTYCMCDTHINNALTHRICVLQ
jgi:hypothetical protein